MPLEQQEKQGQQEQAPPKRFNWKKVAVTTVTLAIIVGIAVAAIYWYINSNTSGETPSLTERPAATPSAEVATPSAETEEAEEDETAGWKTFSHSASGVSFKYPDGWVKVSDLDNSGKTEAENGEIWESAIAFQKTSGVEMIGTFSINTANNPDGLSLEGYVNDHQDDFFIGKELQATSDLKIDNKETAKLIYPASPQAYGMVSYVVAVDTKVYEIGYTVVTGLEAAVPTAEYETIFSTINLP